MNQDEMLSERQSEIAELLRQKGYITVNDLADRLSVTTQTIRRDLQVLVDAGLVRRNHGGVEPADEHGNLPYGAREVLSAGPKARAARMAARQVHDGECVGLGIGTTPSLVAAALAEHCSQLRVVTGSLNAAVAASVNPTFQVSILGGRVRPVDLDVVGPESLEQLGDWDIDVSIVDVAGVAADGGLLDFWQDEAAQRRALTVRAARTYLVLDGSKFGRRAHVKRGLFSDVDAVFTDANPPDDLVAMAERAGVEIHLA